MKQVLLTLGLLVLGALVLTGCEKREDLTGALDLAAPPQPYDLQIVKKSDTIYTVSWKIDDPSLIVSLYRVYSISGFGTSDLIGTTDVLQTDVDTVLPLSGLVFGVSSVTTQNIESDLTAAAAPDTILTGAWSTSD